MLETRHRSTVDSISSGSHSANTPAASNQNIIRVRSPGHTDSCHHKTLMGHFAQKSKPCRLLEKQQSGPVQPADAFSSLRFGNGHTQMKSAAGPSCRGTLALNLTHSQAGDEGMPQVTDSHMAAPTLPLSCLSSRPAHPPPRLSGQPRSESPHPPPPYRRAPSEFTVLMVDQFVQPECDSGLVQGRPREGAAAAPALICGGHEAGGWGRQGGGRALTCACTPGPG